MSSDPPTLESARRSLAEHVAEKGAELRRKYGPRIGWTELNRILADPDFVRYPCALAFDTAPLQPGEIAHAEPKGELPEDGFTLFVHPYFSLDPARVPAIALYQVVAINYGPFASADDAEIFGAAALGIDRDAYYAELCALADELDPAGEPDPGGCGCGG